jgi:hypothetical protein
MKELAMDKIYLVYILIFMVSYGSYFLWRKHAAIKARGQLAKTLDSFLDSDADEDLKELTYFIFQNCLSLWAIPYILKAAFHLTFIHKGSDASTAPEISEENKKIFFLLITQSVVVILNRSPIATLLLTILILFFGVFKALFKGISTGPSITDFDGAFIKAAQHMK